MRVLSNNELIEVSGGIDSSKVVKYPSAAEEWAISVSNAFNSVNFPDIGDDGRPKNTDYYGDLELTRG